jgi:hypothetical protein
MVCKDNSEKTTACLYGRPSVKKRRPFVVVRCWSVRATKSTKIRYTIPLKNHHSIFVYRHFFIISFFLDELK